MVTQGNAVLVVDDMPPRRAAYMRLLAPWATQQKLELVATDLLVDDLWGSQTAMIIISSGGRSVAELHLQNHLPASPDSLPLTVIISDLDDPREVVTALKSGLRAFIPTALSEEMALITLSFVLSGGEYFPISALQARRGMRQPTKGKPQ